MNQFDSKELTLKSIRKICKSTITNHPLRKFYRFRMTRFYGGIVTGDVIGCNLRCAYCWSQKTVWHSNKGFWASVSQAVKKLLHFSKKFDCNQLRLSGGEPTLCRTHLLELLAQIPPDKRFILETNGILLSDASFVQELEQLSNLPYVRISMKAGRKLFPTVTGATIDAYDAQIQAIEHLKKSTLMFNVAVMPEFFVKQELTELKRYIFPKRLEMEQLTVYPFVRERLIERGLQDLIEAAIPSEQNRVCQ